MAEIMVVNAGSSSLKFQLLKMPEETMIAGGNVERIGLKHSVTTIKTDGDEFEEKKDIRDHGEAVRVVLEKLLEHDIIASYEEIDSVGHRIVHGANKITDSCVITDKEIGMLENIIDLAPLHLGPNLTGIKAFMDVLPDVDHVGVFDTAFHKTIPEEAYMYATPYEWYDEYMIRKYGFHGTSHRYVSKRTAEIMGKDVEDVNIIVAHIGNGASLCAVKGGKSVDTSMGFTPLEGIPMGTRSGNIDPAIVEYMMNKKHKSAKEITNQLNKRSGYLGVSGISSDSRDLIAASREGNARAQLAIDIQVKRIVDYIASYHVYMGGTDAIVFTAGIGENTKQTRAAIIDRLSVLGVKIDHERNDCRGVEQLISTDDSAIKVYVVPTNEEVMIARDTMDLADL